MILDVIAENPLLAVVVAGEAGFWVLLGVGLTARDLIRWADQRFAHRFAGGPAPDRPPRHGPQWVRYEWRQWVKFALAWAIACGLMLGMIVLVDAPERTEQLWSWVLRLTIVLVVWFAGWPLRASLTQPVGSGVPQ